MKIIFKAFLLVLLLISLNAKALTDSEALEFTGAVNDGDLKTVKRYVETMNVDLEEGYFAWTPLLMAAAKDQMEVLVYLVNKGANINYTHPVTRFNALHHAAFNGDKKMVKYLIDNGINAQQNLKGDVSIIRALNEDNKKDMADYLLTIGIKDEGCQEVKCF
ncbi:MAG: ankyrin repeat domain-containing protein [Methylophilaceae bacterium]|nr:ankyrin repeat domain-containing protein [Methylophilaceae bacterium]MBL6727043.1 ankyrin repeat domain-containing protein [Methylophilaceae bacterium]MBL6791001.1 ankyrin repeat domain-containing protein [Methylophilaceae bacterium]